jgi:peptidoglycan/xylan/chitin deacetylase (PgdA/CDA1 family)
VLAYHAVSSTWRSPLAISESALRDQLAYLRTRGYVGLTLTEAERRRQDETLPHRSVVFTFDDAYASTMRAADLLARSGYPGTVFVVTRFTDSGAPLSWPGIEHELALHAAGELRPLGWSDAEKLVEAGWEIGSHTVTHPLLTEVDDERLRVELEESRAVIERQVGACTSVAYPYGIADERVAAAARRSGYVVGCTLTFAELVDEPLLRPRTGLTSSDTGIRLALQLSRPGQAARRSAVVRLARMLRRRRSWLPSSGDP